MVYSINVRAIFIAIYCNTFFFRHQFKNPQEYSSPLNGFDWTSQNDILESLLLCGLACPPMDDIFAVLCEFSLLLCLFNVF